MNKVQLKWHLIGLNNFMEIVVMDRRQIYRNKHTKEYTDEKYIEQITQELVALDEYVVFGERYGNELVMKLKEIGGTRRSLWFEKDPDVENDCVFSEDYHMKYTRYSSKMLLKLVQMSSDTSLHPRFSTLFSMRHKNILPTTGDDIAQNMLQQATHINIQGYKASYSDGRSSVMAGTEMNDMSHTSTTSSSSTTLATGKRKDNEPSNSTSINSKDSSSTSHGNIGRQYILTGKYSSVVAYRVVHRDCKKSSLVTTDTKKNSKNQKAQLANISQAMIRFFVKVKVLNFHNQDLSSVFVKCDNTEKILAGTLHCYEKHVEDSKPMFEEAFDCSDDEDDEPKMNTFAFKYSNIDNCYEWKIALSKSQNDIYIQTEMVADIVGRDGTSMKPYVTFPILSNDNSSNTDSNKRNCIEEDR